MSEELREGLAKIVESHFCWVGLPRDTEALMDAVMRYIRQHDGHANFVRAVREIAERAVIRHADGLGEATGTIAIISALCDAELAKEQPK